MWEFYKHDNGTLTSETLTALRHSAYTLLEFTKYMLLGKVQTDGLEHRFGQYRQMAITTLASGSSMNVKADFRLQKTLPIVSDDDLFDTDNVSPQSAAPLSHFDITVESVDLDKLSSPVAVFGYVAGFYVHSVLKVLKCDNCKKLVVEKDAQIDTDIHSLTWKLNRGGLNFPSACVATIVMHAEVVVNKLSNHRDVVKHLIQSLPDFDELHTCENGHEPDLVVGMLARFVGGMLARFVSIGM